MRELGVGQSVARYEDDRLTTGRGQYTSDFEAPRQTWMFVIRSPHAHARINAIDASAALETEGVLAVLTGADVAADKLGTFKPWVTSTGPDGKPNLVPPYRMLPDDIVHFVGEPVAIVVAETRELATDASELVEIDYDPLPAVTDARAALEEGAPQVWDMVPGNLCVLANLGDKEATDAAFAKAHHVARVEQRISRITTVAMEPRSALATWDRRTGRYQLRAGVQGPHQTRAEFAGVLGIPPSQLQVISHDVGGGFGLKGMPHPEPVLALWASKKVERPVKWVSDRGEAFLGDHHARDGYAISELALGADGKFLALRVDSTVNLGSMIAGTGINCAIGNIGGISGVYTTGAVSVLVRGVMTNTGPTSAYRGAGRPEAALMIERVIEQAARDLGMDSAELRRRNLIPPSAMPYKTGFMFTYDSGDFETNQNRAVELSGWNDFETRRKQSAARGRIRGIGMAHVIEISAGIPNEMAELRFDASGRAALIIGTHSHGQGHETTFRQVIAETLSLPPEDVDIQFGDSDALPWGSGTGGSRSIAIGSIAIDTAAKQVIARGKTLAAHFLEHPEDQIEFEEGVFHARGTNRSIGLQDVARNAFIMPKMPAGMELGLYERAMIRAKMPTFPNGCHICEVEIDPETGTLEILAYTVVEDCGKLVNPMIVKGQMHGGIAQGVGQALAENIVFSEDGQLMTASFMDYQMPRADMLPFIHSESNEVLTKANPFGIKGAGEAGTVGALPACMNAIQNALAPLGIRDFDMPATPLRLWEAIQDAKRDEAA